MKDVKPEIYGSRPSSLVPLFVREHIRVILHNWLVTCRGSINADRTTRYIFIKEYPSEEEFHRADGYDEVRRIVRDDLADRVLRVYVDESTQRVFVARHNSATIGYGFFKEALIRLTCCKDIESPQRGSEKSTPFSRFFREQMGSGFSLTDIDYLIVGKNMLLEEKTFVDTVGGEKCGLLGWGQCMSFNELVSDVLRDDVSLWLVFNDATDYYLTRFTSTDCMCINHGKWQEVVPVRLGKKLTRDELVAFVK